MDSLTQAVLGAAVQGSLLGKVQGRKALVYGAALGTLPDLDVLINYGDAVAQMTYHRGFSHSIFLFSALALLLTWLIRRFKPNPDYSFSRLFATIWLVFFTHVFIDACTTYGTQLFWPIPWSLNFSNIFVIDPIYTLPMLIGVLVAAVAGFKRWGLKAVNIGLALSTLYMASTFVNQSLMRQTIEAELSAQKVNVDQLLLMPTPFNTLAWRVLVRDGERYHEGVRSWLDHEPLKLYTRELGVELREALKDSPQHARMRWFTEDWLSYREEQGKLVVTDLRLGLLGAHSFRFVMAERGPDNAWVLNEWVDKLPSNMGTPETRTLLIDKVLGKDVDLAKLNLP